MRGQLHGIPSRKARLARELLALTRATVLLAASLAFLLPAGAQAKAPVITGVTTSPATVVPGGVLAVTVRAQDPDCVDGAGNPATCAGPSSSLCGKHLRDDLTTWRPTTPGTWSVRAPILTGDPANPTNSGPSSPYAATNTWTAPATPGAYTLTVNVADNGDLLCGGSQTASRSILVNVTTSGDLPPVIGALNADPMQMFPGQTIQLTCQASDPGGATLTYAWSADAGTVTPGTDGAATWTSASPAIATVTCRVTAANGLVAAATVKVAATEAKFEREISAGLVAPQRIGADRWGNLYVADQGAGGIVVVRLDGRLVYRLAIPDVTAVAVDWSDRLLVGRETGAELRSRDGVVLTSLVGTPDLGEVADVAVDPVRRLYAVLYRWPARVEIFDQGGALQTAFGAPGDLDPDLRTPTGIAFATNGDVVVADQGHGFLKTFTVGGAYKSKIAGPGSGVGRFATMDDVEVSPAGSLIASDSFLSWVQSFAPDGTVREVLGAWGDGPGLLQTPAGVLVLPAFSRLVAASLNSSSLQVYRFTDGPLTLPEAAAELSPANLSFGDQAVGAEGGPQSATLTNLGSAPLGIQGIRLTGDFAVATGCGSYLEPGASCTLALSFLPAGVGPRYGTLAVETSATAELSLSLAGNGFTAPRLVLSAGGLVFPEQRVRTVSAPQAVRLLNAGSLPLALGEIATTGEFAQGNDCAALLGPGAACTVQVLFAPRTIAPALSGTLLSVGSLALPLSGISVGSAVAASPGQLDFGHVDAGAASAPRLLTLGNNGTLAAQLGALGLGGGQAEAWQLQNDLCSGVTLPPGGNCTVEVVFRPLQGGALSGTVYLASGSDMPMAGIQLAGNAGEQSVIEIPTLSGLGLFLLALPLALAALFLLRRRPRILGCALFALLGGAALATAQTSDAPHWSSQSTANPGGVVINCGTSRFNGGLGCHQTHSSLGSVLTNAATNANVCQQCHAASQVASALPLDSADKAVPRVGGSSHAFDAAAVNAAAGATAPANLQMSLRLSSGQIICSTCHNQHAANSAMGGTPRISPAKKMNGSASPTLVTGGTYTGAGGLWYLVEIAAAGTQGTARYRYSKDTGLSWTPATNCTPGGTTTGCLTASATATTLDATTGVSVAFPAGTYTLSERYEFSASWPFLRAALDAGDNTTGSKFCRDCHSSWTMDHTAAGTYTGTPRSHPVGILLNANGGGYDRAIPLDANGAAQGAGGDGNAGNDLKTDAGGRIQCWTCHAAHFAPSNSAAVIP